MELRRKDKEDKRDTQIVRSARFLETEDGWFFCTREDVMLGPYQDKFDAELSASLLITRLAQLEEGKHPASVIRSFENDPSNATLRSVHRPKPVDLRAIRRKHRINSVRRGVAKTWTAITRLKYVPNLDRHR